MSFRVTEEEFQVLALIMGMAESRIAKLLLFALLTENIQAAYRHNRNTKMTIKNEVNSNIGLDWAVASARVGSLFLSIQ